MMNHWIKTVCLCAAVLAASCAPREKGFEIRGIKGYDWTPQQCLGEIPVLKEFGMNFFAPCYVSFFGEHDRDISSLKELSGTNRWWVPFSEEEKQAWEAVVRECRKDGIAFCFGTVVNVFLVYFDIAPYRQVRRFFLKVCVVHLSVFFNRLNKAPIHRCYHIHRRC